MSNQKKKNAEWIKISNGAFTLLKNRIDNAVNKNLGTFIDKEKINYLPFQEFLQNILDGRFNNAEEAREYYTTNIYKNYEIKMNNVCTPAVEEMKDTFKEVKKNITPTICVDEESTDTDSESRKLDVAQGEKSESEEDTYMSKYEKKDKD